MDYHVRIITAQAELEGIQAAWYELLSQQYDALYACMQYEWIHVFLSTHRADWRVLVVESRKAGQVSKVVGILPLHIVNLTTSAGAAPLKIATPLTARYTPYTDFLIAPEHRKKVWHSILWVLNHHLQLDGALLGRFHDTSLNYGVLLGMLERARYDALPVNMNYWLNPHYLSYQTYADRQSSTTIEAAQYALRRLQKHHNVTIAYQTSALEIERAMDFIIKHKSAQHGDDLYYDEFDKLGEMYKRLAQSTTSVRVLDLYIDGVRKASYLLYHFRDLESYVIGAYDPEFARYSLSKILLHRLIEDAFKARKVICFGQGHFSYKQKWANQAYHLNALACYFNDKAVEYWQAHLDANLIGKMLQVS